MTKSSSEVADEEHFFFTQADNETESVAQTLQRMEQSRQDAKECVANEEPSSLKTSVMELTNIDGNTMLSSMNGNKAIALIQLKQDVDLVLKNLKLKFLGQLYDEVLLSTDISYEHYRANEDSVFPKDGRLFRKYYGKTDSVKHYQVSIPKQLVKQVLRSLHGKVGKHPGNSKTKVDYRKK